MVLHINTSKLYLPLWSKVKVGVLRPVQQPGSYWDRSSELPLVGIYLFGRFCKNECELIKPTEFMSMFYLLPVVQNILYSFFICIDMP